jgi:hypothetical protein
MMCICCDKKISLLSSVHLEDKSEEDIVFNKQKRQLYGKKGRFDEEIELDAGSQMWKDGVVDSITAGFGSNHDMDEFIIAICDDCLEKKLMTGSIALISKHDINNEKYNNMRTAWRRYNRIDDLLE